MREIKFRAWDEEKKVMTKNFGIWAIPQIIQGIKENDLSNSLVLMQYTGLKDKNGKEIYEGDILLTKFEEDDEKNDFIVEWFIDDISCGWNIGPCDTWYSEVISNINENPELIKEV